ncbi:MAG: His-Xaa-Ser system protein HxsD [Candidatus Gastranaerophilaceae bacterium]|jgi:His-Xaa-Ser system protein HxsD
MTKNNTNNCVNIKLKQSIYPLEAIYGASYVFINRAYIYIDTKDEGEIEISLKGKKELNHQKKRELEGEFMNELLNYVQRINISKNTKKMRESIIDRALYSAINEECPCGDEFELDDPLGIAIPWEEKYGDK